MSVWWKSIAAMTALPRNCSTSASCSATSVLPAPGPRLPSLGPISCIAQHPSQVDRLLGIDVLVLRPLESLRLGSQGHDPLTVVALLDCTHRLQQRQPGPPLHPVRYGTADNLPQG